MPEGPSIILVKEEAQLFNNRKVLSVSGNTKTDQQRLLNKKVIEFRSWGKHFLICFSGFTVRIHFLMFGSYLINKRKEQPERLSLVFKNGELNLYACSVKFLEGDINDYYDWSGDVMNDAWSPAKAKVKLKASGESLICDALLEQDIFAGVGNIIKNEILYRVRVHPESIVKKIPAVKLNKLVFESRNYSFEFLAWKRNYELKKHWLAHTKKVCLRCKLPIIKKYTGIKDRRSFFCTHCQLLYI